MTESWPAICTFAAIGILLVLIIRFQLNAFLALLLVSLGLGIAAGMSPVKVVDAIAIGVGDILKGVAVLLALGAILGRMLDAGGAAEVIARTLVNAFGVQRASLAVLLAAYLVGIGVLFNVAFLLLIPIMAQLQRETKKSFLYFVLPLALSLGITHSLIPPKPGIVGAVQNLSGDRAGQVMVETILFGTLMGVPMVLAGWLIPGRLWAKKQFVEAPELLKAPTTTASEPAIAPPSFSLSVFIVTLPLVLSLLGFGGVLFNRLKLLPAWMSRPVLETDVIPGWPPLVIHAPLDWLLFFGKPEMALLIPTLLSMWLLGVRRGMGRQKLAKIAGDSLTEVGGIAFLFAAAGGFKEVIQATGAGDYIANLIMGWRGYISPLLAGYIVAVLMRVALGSATAAILAASGLLAGLAGSLRGQETMLILSVACGAAFMTQPADSGFWMVKEYCNLSVRDVMTRFNACRITMSVVGVLILLVWEAITR